MKVKKVDVLALDFITLPTIKKWFDMIRVGEKGEEYRGHKEYYGKRFANLFELSSMEELDAQLKRCDETGRRFLLAVIFRNGYSHNSPSFMARVSLSIGTGKEEWGAVPGEEYYVLEILEIFEEE